MQDLMESPLVTEKVNCGALGFLAVAVAFSGNWTSTAVFRIVLACDDEIIPLHERIETVGDDADLQEVYDTERHLLYVACTRARDHLLITSVVQALTLIRRGGKARA
jgi:hypothetical protein